MSRWSDLAGLSARPLQTSHVSLASSLESELLALEPGRVLRLRVRDGRRVIVVDEDDFAYIAEKAGLALEQPK